MKDSTLSRCALSVCVAAILLAGCSRTNGTLPPSSAGSPSFRLEQLSPKLAQSPLGGGAFSGGYSGRYATVLYCSLHYHSKVTIKGSGKVSFLHQSTETGEFGAPANMCFGTWHGKVILRSSKHPRNSIKIEISGKDYPCLKQTFSYTVTGGTGKFAKATGNGNVRFQCQGSGRGTYSDQWSGTLSF